MKSLILASSLLFPTLSLANPSYNLTATSDYLWRGLSQTAHQSAIQGGIDTELIPGLTGSLWTSNVEKGSEVDVIAKYTHSLSQGISLGIGGTLYYYTQNNATNTGEANLLLTTPRAFLSVNYTGNYFGSKTSSFYYEISQTISLNAEKKISLVPTVGFVTFEDTEKTQVKNYLNYKLEILKEYDFFNFRLFYANTDRKTVSSGIESRPNDESIAVSISKNF